MRRWTRCSRRRTSCGTTRTGSRTRGCGPGGQGINVARAALELGARALAIAPLGGAVGRLLADSMEEEGVLRGVAIAGETRLFVEARVLPRAPDLARTLLLNPRGPALTAQEADRLEAAVREAIGDLRPHVVACCGSLPPGLPADFYARIGRHAADSGAAFVPDCDGEALAIAAPVAHVLVPNRHEAARLLGREIGTVDSAAEAALELSRLGEADRAPRRWAAIKLGGRGAVLAVGADVWRCTAPAVEDPGSAVGAGDAFLAGLLVARTAGAEAAEALAAAVGAGSAVLRARGSRMIEAGGARALTRLVQVTALRKGD
ncbi:MAG TPA: PfkB family carbohydrate kinase [Longimicrobiales bacterium]|nr:PfkB family carbohydrate kinase [Longimicrobiales bacterium]